MPFCSAPGGWGPLSGGGSLLSACFVHVSLGTVVLLLVGARTVALVRAVRRLRRYSVLEGDAGALTRLDILAVCSLVLVSLSHALALVLAAAGVDGGDGDITYLYETLHAVFWGAHAAAAFRGATLHAAVATDGRLTWFLALAAELLRGAELVERDSLEAGFYTCLVGVVGLTGASLAGLLASGSDEYGRLTGLALNGDEKGALVLDLEKTEEVDTPSVLRVLWPYLWPRGEIFVKLRVIVAMLLLVSGKVSNLLVPIFLSESVDELSKDGDLRLPLLAILMYGFLRIAASTCDNLRSAVFIQVTDRALRAAATETFVHLHGLSMRFHIQRQTGGVLRLLDRGTKAIQYLCGFVLYSIAPSLLEVLLVTLYLLGRYPSEWYIAVVIIVDVAIYVGYTLYLTEWRRHIRRDMNSKDNAANTKATDSLLAAETVKFFCNEDHEAARYDEALALYVDASIKSQATLAILNIGQQAIIGLGLTVVMVLAGQAVVDGDFTVGDFVLVNVYLIQLFLPLNFLGSAYNTIRQSVVDLENLFALLRVNAEVQDAPDAQPLQPEAGPPEVVFEDVTFAYGEDDRNVLDGVSFRIPAGHTVAIVGPTGSGKTTTSRLLYRFYDVTGGRILVDGQDIGRVTQRSLRRQIGIVPQDTVLFNDTIAYNIKYGKIDATDAEMVAAAEAAQVHDFVMKQPDKYETKVGERGLRLSGGEKQRVSIARLILYNPRILILDEATSALDSKTERQIKDALDRVCQGRTSLVIAHRLSTVVDADKIIVLKDGKILEQGNHQELLAMRGEYAEMYTRQVEEQAVEDVGTAGQDDEGPPKL